MAGLPLYTRDISKGQTTEGIGTMTTTTQITNIFHAVLDIDPWFSGDNTEGDPFEGFDIDAIRTEHLDAVQVTASRLLGHDVTIARNGDVLAATEDAAAIFEAMETYGDEPNGFWGFVAESVDLETIALRHQTH